MDETTNLITRGLIIAAMTSPNNKFVQNSLLAHLEELNLGQLTTFYLENKPYREFLCSDPLLEFWQTRLEKFQPIPGREFQFKPQSLLTPGGILLGYGCFALLGGTEESLCEGLRLSSFHCAFKLINTHLKEVIKAKSKEVFIEQASQLCQLLETPWLIETITANQTPGFLLYANTYLQLANHCNDTVLIGSYITKALEFLYRALWAEPDSIDAIHNAYLGQGLKLSNPHQIEDCQTMLTSLIKVIPLNPSDLENKINQAKAYAKQPLQCSSPLDKNFELPRVINYKTMPEKETDCDGNNRLHLALLNHDFASCKELMTEFPELKVQPNQADLTPVELAQKAKIQLPRWLQTMSQQSPAQPTAKSSLFNTVNYQNSLIKKGNTTQPGHSRPAY